MHFLCSIFLHDRLFCSGATGLDSLYLTFTVCVLYEMLGACFLSYCLTNWPQWGGGRGKRGNLLVTSTVMMLVLAITYLYRFHLLYNSGNYIFIFIPLVLQWWQLHIYIDSTCSTMVAITYLYRFHLLYNSGNYIFIFIPLVLQWWQLHIYIDSTCSTIVTITYLYRSHLFYNGGNYIFI